MLAANRSSRLLVCALIAAALYLPGLGRPALWEPDEGRYAEIAREIVLTGDYVTPRNNFELYFEKPPLVYWATAAAIRVFGATEFAVRMPAAVFSIGQVVMTAAIADAVLGATAGMLAALALMLSPLFFAFARFATLDPALAFFLTAAMGAFLMAAREESFAAPRARYWMLASSAMLALGTLAKGPVALVLGGGVALVWMALERRLGDVRRMPLLWCAAIYMVIVAPWFILAESRNPGFLNFFFIHEHLQRYVSSREHGWGPWFFIPIVAGGAWPWIFFAPLGWSAMRRGVSRSAGAGRIDGASFARFLAAWFAVIFAFFSIPQSKLGTYILPAFPPLAIFAGYGLSQIGALADAPRRRMLAYFAAGNVALAVIAAAVLVLIVDASQRALVIDAAIVGLAITAGASLMYVAGRDAARVTLGIGALALAMIAVVATTERARQDAAPMNTYRNLARAIQPYLAGDCALVSYRHYVQSLPFYTLRRETRAVYWGELSEVAPPTGAKSPYLLGSDARLREAWSAAACMVVVANLKDLPALRAALKPAPAIVGCEGKKFALYNRDIAIAPDADAARCRARADAAPPP